MVLFEPRALRCFPPHLQVLPSTWVRHLVCPLLLAVASGMHRQSDVGTARLSHVSALEAKNRVASTDFLRSDVFEIIGVYKVELGLR